MLPPVIADVNVSGRVVRWLRAQGCDVTWLPEDGFWRLTDREILAIGHAEGRFVLTHDSDFGKLAMADGEPLYGIIQIRPGDREVDLIIEDLQALADMDVDWTPPLIAVVKEGRRRLHNP